MIKRQIAKKFKVNKNGLYVCDVWKSNIHREFRNGSGDHVSDISRKSDDIFVYYSVYKKKDDNTSNIDDQMKNDVTRFQAFVITFEKDAQRMYHYYRQEELMGYPILVTFDLNISVTIKEIRDRIWELINAFIPNFNMNDYNKNNKKSDNEKPFKMEIRYRFNSVTELTDSDEIFDLSQRNIKFAIHFNDPTMYHNDGYDYTTRVRDLSAPEKINRSVEIDTAKEYRYVASMDLEECIDIDESCRANRLSQHNLWYCKTCKYFQCIKNKLNLWNSPDLLIIHLNRFKDDYIDMLIKFTIDQGLFLPKDSKNIAFYELYAIKNYDKTSRTGVACKVCIFVQFGIFF